MSAQAYRLTPFDEPVALPNALASKRNWICWRADPDYDAQGVLKPKPKKTPIIVGAGTSYSWQKAGNHVSYGEAVDAVAKHKLSGIGFVLTPGCGLVGGDLDGCRDPATGAIDAWAQAIIDLRETYFEVSPSGAGIRFWALSGDIPMTLKKDEAGVELYSTGRYLTFTGLHIAGTPWQAQRATKTVDALFERAATFKPDRSAAQAAVAAVLDPTSVEAFERKVYRDSPMGQINQAAMANFDAWVPELLPEATKTADGGYRVRSKDLGRALEEDLSISPVGIMDFGVHDQGDERQGRRTPIDVVVEHSGEPDMDARAAADWLVKRLGMPDPFLDVASGGASSGPSPEDLKVVDDWLAALARLRAASPHPAFVTGGAVNGKFDPAYSGPVALRPGVTDRLTRGFVASVSSAANAGKSTYLGSEALAVVCERPDILGLPEIDWCGNVAIISNEESQNTLTCRWRGVMKAHGLTAADLKHEIVFWPTDKGRLRIGRGGRDKRVTPTSDGVRCVTWLAEMAERGSPVAVLGIDTLVSIFEGVDENGAEMDKAVGLLIQIAEAGFIAIDVMQHQGKGAEDKKETIQGYRGSSAIFAALAEMSTLVTLSAAEGHNYGLDPLASARTVRLMGQRQRDGAIPGTWHLQREIVSLPAEDPRAIGVLASRTVTVLRPVVLGIVAMAGDVDEAWRVLWDEQSLHGRVLRRGTAGGVGRGRKHADQAPVIVEAALGWSPLRAGRACDELGISGGWKLRKGRDKNNNLVDFIDVVEPPAPPPGPF